MSSKPPTFIFLKSDSLITITGLFTFFSVNQCSYLSGFLLVMSCLDVSLKQNPVSAFTDRYCLERMARFHSCSLLSRPQLQNCNLRDKMTIQRPSVTSLKIKNSFSFRFMRCSSQNQTPASPDLKPLLAMPALMQRRHK